MTTTASQPPAPTSDAGTDVSDGSRLGSVSIALAIAGLLPVLPFAGSLGAIVCGWLARSAGPEERRRGQVGISLGALGVLVPVLALFVYCVVLGYPFPIHRYRPD